MVRQSENNVDAAIKLPGISLTTRQGCEDSSNATAHATALNNIVRQVVDELCSVAQTTPISHVVLSGTKQRQIHRLMSQHPAMPVTVVLITEPVDNDHGRNTVRDQPRSVYSINTDCYPFSNRFS